MEWTCGHRSWIVAINSIPDIPGIFISVIMISIALFSIISNAFAPDNASWTVPIPNDSHGIVSANVSTTERSSSTNNNCSMSVHLLIRIVVVMPCNDDLYTTERGMVVG